jgi:ubiquinone/menaquinone biosynthesis C-methylase UbiE
MSRKAYFNQAAEYWDEKYCTPDLYKFLESFVPKFGLESGQRILDVGTGTGVLIPFLLEVVGSDGSVTAIDYAENMIEKCKSKFSNTRNLKIKLQAVEELNHDSNSFDAVTCFGLFPHIEDREKALRNILEVLKPGGELIIAHALNREQLRRHHYNSASAVRGDVLPDDFEMESLLKKTGFEMVSITEDASSYLCISYKPETLNYLV